LGASGNFGARILRDLRQDSRFETIPATRNARANPMAQGLRTVELDFRSANFAAALARLRPQLVIHCAGPFQGQDYSVARAALAAGSHYLDLADGRRFVADFANANHASALAADRLAVSGASTLPALSGAVVERLRHGFDEIETVEIVIAPAQRAPRGAATIAAVFGYLGRPFPVLRNGALAYAWGWQDLRRVPLAIGARWAAACDVPDLELLPRTYPSLRTATFHAALEVGAQHFFLWTLAALLRGGIPVPLARWAARLDRIAGLFDVLGSETGAMWVRVDGKTKESKKIQRIWHLVAPRNHGPEIPCMPATLLAQRLARGEIAARGAHACIGFLTLDDFESEFRRWRIETYIEEGGRHSRRARLRGQPSAARRI